MVSSIFCISTRPREFKHDLVCSFFFGNFMLQKYHIPDSTDLLRYQANFFL